MTLKERQEQSLRDKQEQILKEQANRRRSSSRPPIPGPTTSLQSILEKLGILNNLHNNLVARVDKLEVCRSTETYLLKCESDHSN